jgi:hypothetical protein
MLVSAKIKKAGKHEEKTAQRKLKRLVRKKKRKFALFPPSHTLSPDPEQSRSAEQKGRVFRKIYIVLNICKYYY